jgi:NAD(P)-dependent dehydrogenase (short-subunit alcohol dehydrogenase family)
MHHLFLDESGDHSLTYIDAGYPVFALGGILVKDDSILENIEQAVAAFKRDFFGTADIVLHTADITRNRRGFESLTDPEARGRFQRRLNALLASLEFTVVACVIRKRALL